MASSTTAGVGQPPTATIVTATAGGSAAGDDRFDPFLPAIEPAVDELSLQQSMDVNKECELSVYFVADSTVTIRKQSRQFRTQASAYTLKLVEHLKEIAFSD